MLNVNEIKAEAKEQIIKLLDQMGCYEFNAESIDIWLDVWERACSPQIEQIAEKSEYYDGKCKIVFPAEYPRDINREGIFTFTHWLREFATRNLKPAILNGYSREDANCLYSFYNYLHELKYYYPTYKKCLPKEVKDVMEELMIVADTPEFEAHKREWSLARNEFDYADDKIIKIDGRAFLMEEYLSSGVNEVSRLAYILELNDATAQFVTEEVAYKLNQYFDCSITAGQKLSRAVNKIARKYGIDKDPEWNREFAKYADSINPLVVTKWTVISWHPIDYLTFCFGNTWSTCSTIDKHNVRGTKLTSSRSSVTDYVHEDYHFRGEHCAAALSYMFDESSFIYYTVNHRYDGTHYEEQDKESRIVFALNEDMDTLLQTRLYPQCHDDGDSNNYRIPREIVQKVIADAINVPNLWKMRKGRATCEEYVSSTGVHYDDFRDNRNKECNISWRGDSPKLIKIGHKAICPECGCEHSHISSLNCEECDPEYESDY